jgi:hemerythrin superfamily protein
MDAIQLLTQQHRLVERLFRSFEKAKEKIEAREYFAEIADHLTIHTLIEERHFYPAVCAQKTERNVETAFDEHLEIKRLLSDAMSAESAPAFEDMVAALKGAVEHHVEEEEGELFPKAKELLESKDLDALGETMEADAEELKGEGAPRKRLRVGMEPAAANP